MIKASLLLVLAYCLSKLFRHRSAAERHILWVAAIFAAALLPLMILVLPELRFQVSSQIAAVVLPDGALRRLRLLLDRQRWLRRGHWPAAASVRQVAAPSSQRIPSTAVRTGIVLH